MLLGKTPGQLDLTTLERELYEEKKKGFEDLSTAGLDGLQPGRCRLSNPERMFFESEDIDRQTGIR